VGPPQTENKGTGKIALKVAPVKSGACAIEKSNEIVEIPAVIDRMSIEGGGDDRCDGL